MAINKVVYGGDTLIDLTDTTATAQDVASGKYFYGVDGVKTAGIASPGGIDPSDATATAANIFSGKTAYIAGGKTTGTYTYSPYGGPPMTLLQTFTAISGNLKDDSTWDEWSPTTTATTIKATATAGTFTADIANYDYLVQWQGWVDIRTLSGATLKAMPYAFTVPMNCWIGRRATTVANIRAENYVTNSYQVNSYSECWYYNSSGNITMGNTTYGIYWEHQAPTFSSATSSSPTVTVKTPLLRCRTSTTYMAAARCAEIDSENSTFYMVGKLYQIEKRSGYYMDMWYINCDLFNTVEEEKNK